MFFVNEEFSTVALFLINLPLPFERAGKMENM